MAQPIHSVRCAALPSGVELLGFRGEEALNELYAFSFAVSVPSDAPFDMDGAIGSRATLVTRSPKHAAPMLVHGVLAGIENVHDIDGRAVYLATLVPHLWYSGQGLHSRVFVGQSAPEIIASVLASDGLDGDAVRFELGETYAKLEHVCQYKESNLAFVTRWLEREGMYYYFDHTGEREILVLTDKLLALHPGPQAPVRYVPGSDRDTGVGEALYQFRRRSAALPSTVQYRDYNPKNPTLDVRGRAGVTVHGRAEVNVHGSNFVTPAEGQRYARIKAEELRSRQQIVSASGRAFDLRPGFTFSLEQHPHAAFNTTYLVTRAEHQGTEAVGSAFVRELVGLSTEDEYKVDVAAIPSSVQWRPEQRTPSPRIYGMEMAVVDGPSASAYAQMNADGCYKVKIHFDESDLSGGGASTWVRMLQPHGGTVEGFHFPLRAGTEVMLAFLGGDPDRPVISGVAPNASTPSPVTAGNASMNVLQSGSFNRMEMQDQEGCEHVRLQTPNEKTFFHMGAKLAKHNLEANTEGDGRWRTGGDSDCEIGGKHTKHVHGDVERTYDANEEIRIEGNQSLTVAKNQEIDVEGTQDVTVGGEVKTDFKDNWIAEVAGKLDLHVEKDVKVTVGGDFMETVDGFITVRAEGNIWARTERDWMASAGRDLKLIAGRDLIETVEGSKKTTVEGDVSLEGKNFTQTFEHGKYSVVCKQYHVVYDEDVSLTIENAQNINAGANVDITVGAHLGIQIGASAEIFAGFTWEESMGIAISHHLGLKQDIEAGSCSITDATTKLVSTMAAYILTGPLSAFV